MKVEKYFATWCGPCQALEPVFEDLDEEFPGVEFEEVNVDLKPGRARESNVKTLPTVIIKEDGEELHRITGQAPKSFYKEQINGHL